MQNRIWLFIIKVLPDVACESHATKQNATIFATYTFAENIFCVRVKDLNGDCIQLLRLQAFSFHICFENFHRIRNIVCK